MNSKGQIIITDLLFYLIIITIIMGMIIYTISILNDNEMDKINEDEFNQAINDFTKQLTENKGEPTNWEKISSDKITSIGLKSNDNTSLISYNKLIKLKYTSNILKNQISGTNYYSISYYLKDNPNNKTIVSQNVPSSTNNVKSRQIPIMFDYGYDVISITHDKGYCSLNHNESWACATITINKTNLTGKYYILTNNHTPCVLSNTYGDKINLTIDDTEDITNKITSLIKDDSDAISIHLKTDNKNNYLVNDKYKVPEHLNSIRKPEVYVLDIKLYK